MTTVITGLNDGLIQGKNLSTKYVGANPDTFELEVVVDEKTIKHDGSAYYVDTAELGVVSKDEGNLIVEGSDSGALLKDIAPNPDIGDTYTKRLVYMDTDTNEEEVLLDAVAEGVYIGHIEVRKQGETVAQMEDMYIGMYTNGGTVVKGYRAHIGESRPAPEVDRASASCMCSVRSNGVDPVKVKIECDADGRFRGYIYCTLIRIA